jgi:acetolactate synthase-1/2/3 large subunit
MSDERPAAGEHSTSASHPPARAVDGHGGHLVLDALAAYGVDALFTLSGGHLFPFYDAAVTRGDVRLLDVRHEQTAVFAAEGVAKLTRRPGVAALTAGPGVTNGISGVVSASFNGSPLVVLGGRSSDAGWGRGALQEFDHVPMMTPITKHAVTAHDVAGLTETTAHAVRTACAPHRGPVFVDYPLDVLFARGSTTWTPVPVEAACEPDPDRVAALAQALASAARPAIVAGTDVYWEGAWPELAAVAEHLRVPVFANGMGRGCLPADHELAFSRTRSLLKREADLVVVVGTPLDFRLGFGDFGGAAVAHVVESPERACAHREVAHVVVGDLRAVLGGLAAAPGPRVDHEAWLTRLRDAERAAAAAEAPLLEADAPLVKPTRIYGELRKQLERDAIVVCDGGDFVSYAGKYLDTFVPGHWLDAGPFGCLGTSMGYALAAHAAKPGTQCVVMLGDGAAGFTLGDLDTLVRHQVPAVIVVGNNGIWALERGPMRMLYGYDVVAELRPGTRYDEVCVALGGGGELVTGPAGIAPALARAFASGVPYVVNVLTDPDDTYPRQSSLG